MKYKHGATRFANDHPRYQWNVNGVKELLKMIERLVTLLGKKVRAEVNIELMAEMILNQEDQPGTHSTSVDIAREPNTSISVPCN